MEVQAAKLPSAWRNIAGGIGERRSGKAPNLYAAGGPSNRQTACGSRAIPALRRNEPCPSRPRVGAVLVVVAIQAQQFPVAAVRRIVVVVMVAVMHGQFVTVAASNSRAQRPQIHG